MLGAQQMGPRPGGLAGDPAALAGAGGDPPVQGHGQLQGYQRAVLPDAQEEAGIDLCRLALAEAERDAHAAALQPIDALAADPGIGVLHGDDGALYPGGGQGIGAGRGLAIMAAGLERDIGRGPPCRLAGAAKRFGFGMGPSAGLGPAAAHDPSLADQDAADGGIGPAPAQGAARQGEGRAHMPGVVGPGLSRCRDRHRSCPRIPRNPWPRGNCDRPRQSAHRRPCRGRAARPSPSRR